VLEPGLERTVRRIVFERRHGLGDGNDRLLNHILGFRFRESGPDGDPVDEFPIRVEEFAPAFLIVPVFESAQERPARRNDFIRLVGHKHTHSISSVNRLARGQSFIASF
jgi:hypothetical protein